MQPFHFEEVALRSAHTEQRMFALTLWITMEDQLLRIEIIGTKRLKNWI